MAKTTESEKGLTISYETGEFSSVEILVDLDMRTGTPVEETGWLDGNSGGSYPGGGLATFTASNADGSAAGSLRMITLNLGAVSTAAVTVTLASGASGSGDDLDDGTPLTKIVTIVGQSGGMAATISDTLELTLAVGSAGTVTFLVL